jgi:hypothetical protein
MPPQASFDHFTHVFIRFFSSDEFSPYADAMPLLMLALRHFRCDTHFAKPSYIFGINIA